MKNIGVLIRNENTEEENRCYFDAIEKFNGTVIKIDDNAQIDTLKNKLKNIDGLLLTGGNNVGRLDFFLIDYALKNNLKLLGICQGMQSMALYGTSDKLVNIGNNLHKQDEGYVHNVSLVKSKLMDIVGKAGLCVNSHHYQTVSESKIFRIVGYSEDGLIEAVENSNHKFQIGIQWHPERMLEYDVISEKILSSFINS